MPPTIVLATAAQPGAVAMVQLHGSGSHELLRRLTGDPALPVERLRLRDLGGIDEGLVVALGDDWAQIMPHGGPRVVQRLIDHLLDLGATIDADPDARQVYPEAGSPIEADVLAAIARAASPAAIDLLAAQHGLWREDFASRAGSSPSREAGKQDRGGGPPGSLKSGELLEQGRTLDRLLDPPSVVVVGRPNVGKSTLTNAMLGRSVSLVADLPGTTRDWVAGLAELSFKVQSSTFKCENRESETSSLDVETQAVAVRWTDTPGVRSSDDAIEQEAIRIARDVIEQADVLIAMRDPESDWPDVDALPRRPDLYVVNKRDRQAARRVAPLNQEGRSRDHALPISARDDRNLDRLQHRVVAHLGLAELLTRESPPLWPFSPTLREAMSDPAMDLAAYLDGGSYRRR